MSRAVLRWLAALWLACGLAFSAQAGRSCDPPHAPATQQMLRGLELAERTYHALEASGAQVVLLARAGQNLTAYGLRYSHLGFAYQQDDGQGGHMWRVLHKLNECGTAEASIYRQGLGQFFMDNPWRYEAAWVVPAPEVQARLLALLRDPARATLMQHKPYSLVSYPWALKYQQSNQWALETLAAAMDDDARTRPQAQAWLQLKGYQPSVLNIGAFTRLGARMSRANVAFDDHPNDKRFSDRIETVTVDSMFAWMQRNRLAGPTTRLGL